MATQRPAGLVPVGAIIAFDLSHSNTPSLPDEYVQCNGQTLSDTQSVYNTTVIRNLNGSGGNQKYFLRGSTTSGGTGGADTHLHGISTAGFDGGNPGSVSYGNDVQTAIASTLPVYMEMVFIMRIK